MVFSNFAQVLYSVLAEGRSFAQFTRNLFLNITDYSDSEENPIEDAEDGTLKKPTIREKMAFQDLQRK